MRLGLSRERPKSGRPCWNGPVVTRASRRVPAQPARSTWQVQGRGDGFRVITAHDQLVELSTLQIHPNATRGVVMNDSEDLGVSGSECPYRHRARNARRDSEPVDRSDGVIEHLDRPHGLEGHFDLAVNGFDPFHRSQTDHQLVPVHDDLGHAVPFR